MLGATCIAPVVVRADDHPYNKWHYDNRRYYDRDGRGYDVWNVLRRAKIASGALAGGERPQRA